MGSNLLILTNDATCYLDLTATDAWLMYTAMWRITVATVVASAAAAAAGLTDYYTFHTPKVD